LSFPLLRSNNSVQRFHTASVNRVAFVMSAVCRVYPKQQTYPDPLGTSHLCQERTFSRVMDVNRLEGAVCLQLVRCRGGGEDTKLTEQR
jgi:hypothetical protein